MADHKRKSSYRQWHEIQQYVSTHNDLLGGITKHSKDADIVTVAWWTRPHVTNRARKVFNTRLHFESSACKIRFLQTLPIRETYSKSRQRLELIHNGFYEPMPERSRGGAQ